MFSDPGCGELYQLKKARKLALVVLVESFDSLSKRALADRVCRRDEAISTESRGRNNWTKVSRDFGIGWVWPRVDTKVSRLGPQRDLTGGDGA